VIDTHISPTAQHTTGSGSAQVSPRAEYLRVKASPSWYSYEFPISEITLSWSPSARLRTVPLEARKLFIDRDCSGSGVIRLPLGGPQPRTIQGDVCRTALYRVAEACEHTVARER
jgi:hypothetical protein